MSDASGVFFIFAVTYLVSKNVLSVMVGDILQTIQMQCAFKSSFSFLVFSTEVDPQDGSVDILNKFGDKIAHYEPLRSNSAGRGVTGILLLGEVRLVPGTSCMDTCLNRHTAADNGPPRRSVGCRTIRGSCGALRWQDNHSAGKRQRVSRRHFQSPYLTF